MMASSSKLNRYTFISRISEGFTHGLAQMVGAGRSKRPNQLRMRTDADALKSDWQKVGLDLSRAMERGPVSAHEKA